MERFMAVHGRRAGFAVPMAILLIGVITAGVVGVFARVESANTVSGPQARSVAYAYAETGVDEYLAAHGFPDDGAYTFMDGGARVKVERLRDDDGVNGALYMIHSTGFVTRAPGPPARHSVVQLARLDGSCEAATDRSGSTSCLRPIDNAWFDGAAY